MAKERRPDWKRMGAAARRRRGELGFRQVDVAREGLSVETIRRIEAGDQATYRTSTLAAYASRLGWPPDALETIARGGDPPTPVDVTARIADVEQVLERQTLIMARLVELASTMNDGIAGLRSPLTDLLVEIRDQRNLLARALSSQPPARR